MTRSIHYSIVKQIDQFGSTVPILYVSETDNEGCEVIRTPQGLRDYLDENRGYSLQWKMTTCRSFGLFYDYTRQRAAALHGLALENVVNIHHLILTEFVRDLRRGTIRDLHRFPDATGLHWPPASSNARVKELIRALDDLLTWIHNNGDRRKLASIYGGWDHNEPHHYTSGDALRFLYSAKYVRQFSLLGHLKLVKRRVLRAPTTGQLGREGRLGDGAKAKRFPVKFLSPLLIDGFEKNRDAVEPLDRFDVTGRLAAVLLAGSGIRSSEMFHLWVNDFTIEAGQPLVFLRDPVRSLMKAPNGALLTREQFLQTYYQWPAP